MVVSLSERCKLCLLIEQDASLWTEVHRRVFVDKLKQASVCRWLNGRIEIKNQSLPHDVQMPMFQRENFYAHFNKRHHISSMEEVKSACQVGFATIAGGGKRIKIHRAVQKNLAERAALSDEVHDFKRMRALINASERRLHAFDNQMAKKEIAEGEDHKVDLTEIATFQKLTSDLLRLKKEAIKVENSSRIAGEALKETVELLVDATLERVESVATEVQNQLVREMPGSRLPEQMSHLLRSRIGDAMKMSVPEVLTAIYNRYGIK